MPIHLRPTFTRRSEFKAAYNTPTTCICLKCKSKNKHLCNFKLRIKNADYEWDYEICPFCVPMYGRKVFEILSGLTLTL